MAYYTIEEITRYITEETSRGKVASVPVQDLAQSVGAERKIGDELFLQHGRDTARKIAEEFGLTCEERQRPYAVEFRDESGIRHRAVRVNKDITRITREIRW